METWVEKLTADVPIPEPHAKGEAEVVSARSTVVAESSHHQETVIDKIFRHASIGGAVIALSPFALNQVGIGKREFEFLGKNGSCCQLIAANGPSWTKTTDGEQTYGIAGAISSTLERLPVVGGDLSRGGMPNAIAAGGVIIAGHYIGKGLEGRAIKNGKDGKLGRIIKNGSHLFGVVLALPAILPGIGHGVEFLSAVARVDDLDMQNATANGPAVKLMGLLGKNPGVCKGNNKLSDGAMGAASIPVAQLCCALPAIVSSIPHIFKKSREEEQDKGQER